MTPRKPTAHDFWTLAKYSAAGLVAAQATAVSAVVAIDNERKRRRPQSGRFPHLPPLYVDVADNAMRLYTYGQDLYDDMLDDIAAARERIFFEWFIVKNDATGNRFRSALIEAGQRGVKVHLIFDTWGNANQDPRFRHFRKAENVWATQFPFVRPGVLTRRARDRGRDHRKILAIDGRIGYVGGYNIGDLYAEHWRDTHVRIDGPATWSLEQAFVTMWNSYRRGKAPELDISGSQDWNARVRTVTNTPSQDVYPIRSTYLDALSRATERAWITMAYFIPDDAMVSALIAAAGRGADVRVLVPEYSNHIYVDWVSRPHYHTLLSAGVRLYLYEEAMVHAKTMTIDGKWATVGTANIDRLSMRGNFEINLEVFDDEFALAMEQIYRVDLENCHELTLEDWDKRSATAKFTEELLRPLAPLL